MAEVNANVDCRMLDEFVDDASGTHKEPCRPKPTKDDCLQGLIRQIASEMAVPQTCLGEVVAKVVASVGPNIEAQVRKELEEVMQRQGQS